MADSKIIITAGLSRDESVNTIKNDLKYVSDRLTADKALKIICNIDLGKTTQRIQSQLATISKNLKIDVPQISANVDTGDASKKVGTIATVYAEGAKQADVLHRKQELLKQDYEILAEKIKKAGQNIDSVATRDNVNYNKVFTDIIGKDILDNNTLSRARDALATIRKEFQLLNAKFASDLPENAIENYTAKIEKLNADIKNVTKDYKNLSSVSDELRTKFEELGKVQGKLNAPVDSENISKEDLSQRIKDYTQIKRLVGSIKIDVKEAAQAEQKATKDRSAAETLSNRISKASAVLTDYANKNKKAVNSTKTMSDGVTTFAEKWKYLVSQIQRGKTVELSPDEFKHLNEEIATFKKEADAAGLTVNSFFRSMRTQLSYVIMQWVSLQGAVRYIRDMVNEVIAIDTAMTNLKKVTDENDSAYEKFLTKANTQAKNLHSTISDLVTQTSEWAKLGYDLKDAQDLAEISMIYSKVGEVDNDTAVKDLVTAMKAFNIEGNNAIEIVNRYNKLGNEFATSAADLGNGLRVSASALSAAGNDLSQSLAMLTGATEITQNAQETGAALRIISMRIRGMKGELQALNEETEGIESISKIQTQILNLTNNRVNIFNDDGSFKSTYDILKSISEIYYDLSDTSRANLTEILFGKNRANQGLAVLQAFQSGQIEKAYEAAMNSAGSAQAEFDKWSESIEAHINDFKEAWENLSKDLLKSDFLKALIDTGTTFINLLDKIIDKVGVLPTILTSLAAVGSFKGVGRPHKPNMPKLVLLRINVRSDTPQNQRAFQMLELRVADTQPKAA